MDFLVHMSSFTDFYLIWFEVFNYLKLFDQIIMCMSDLPLSFQMLNLTSSFCLSGSASSFFMSSFPVSELFFIVEVRGSSIFESMIELFFSPAANCFLAFTRIKVCSALWNYGSRLNCISWLKLLIFFEFLFSLFRNVRLPGTPEKLSCAGSMTPLLEIVTSTGEFGRAYGSVNVDGI